VAAVQLGPRPSAERLIEGLETATRVLVAVIAAADPDEKAVIWRRPIVQTATPGDFAPRAGLELILHAHDVCQGLAVAFEPPPDLCERLRDHTRGWPMWHGAWSAPGTTQDPWDDLLWASKRR
jgi:hypothetical protein